MTIPKNVIEKFQLQPTNEQIGESFYYNQRIFKSQISGLESIRFMECDPSGKPSKYIEIVNPKTKTAFTVTPEFMDDIAINAIIDKMLTE